MNRVPAACLLAVLGATALNAQPQRFRGGVELVSLNVTVTDPAGKYVTDLTEPDFEVYEDGARQALTFFSRTQQPISLALLLDTSASMEERMGIAQEAAIGFARQLHRDDQAEVIDFDSQVRVLSPFTNDASALEKAIRTTTANGSTSLYNALYIALKELKKTRISTSSDIRRQAIVLLSDGDDTSSLIEFDQVLDLAKRSETVIYSIGLRQGEIARREFKEAEFVLKQLSTETGGRAYFPTDARELAKIYQSIWDELSSQYALAYSSSNPKRDGAWRRIQVRALKPGLTARTKQGYYGPTGS
ncbi:MAG TPA: VWA domain-containing protein [Vicinamibacterales bacterium]|jgi:Ca-activated chloride channel family protein|nr:VWA domain-containing protein [Vicinamibacterales bacterium]